MTELTPITPDLTPAQIAARLVASLTAGALLYGAVSGTAPLQQLAPAAAAGQLLRTAGPAAAPAWGNLADQITGAVVSISGTVTAARTITIPDASLEIQGTHEVIAASWAARNHGAYTLTATGTATDPGTPSPGHEFTTLVRNGTATIGGTTYAVAGSIIRRVYHSGSWANYLYPHLDGAWTWTAAQTFNLSATIGTGIGLRSLVINGGNSGANGGASIYLQQGGVTGCAFGNISSILGGAYDSSTSVWTAASTPIKFYAGSTVYGQFDSSGNFGIGVTPLYHLDSAGSTTLGLTGQPTNLPGCVRANYGMSVSDTLGDTREVFRIGNNRGATAADRLAFSMRRAATSGTWEYTNWIIGRVVDTAQQCAIQFGTDSAVDLMRVTSGGLCFNTEGTVGNGLLQLASGTTKDNGIAFGTDTFLYRVAAGQTTFAASTGTDSIINALRSTGENAVLQAGLNVVVVGSASNHPVWIRSNGIQVLTLDSSSNVVMGTGALATTATNGFLYLETCAGAPTGVPTSFTGRVPMIYDTTNNKLWVYNGAWKGVVLT